MPTIGCLGVGKIDLRMIPDTKIHGKPCHPSSMDSGPAVSLLRHRDSDLMALLIGGSSMADELPERG